MTFRTFRTLGAEQVRKVRHNRIRRTSYWGAGCGAEAKCGLQGAERADQLMARTSRQWRAK
jgi:hypothetical protein